MKPSCSRLSIIVMLLTVFAVPQVHAQPSSKPLIVSFSDANNAEWLKSLPIEERDDQIRDWAVLGLAGLLNINTEALRDFAYDKTPVRDELFHDLAANVVGPGRSLPDGKGTLHLLVPQKDPYAARTIGMLLDDYRKDRGDDPKSVQIYRYRIDWPAQKIALKPEAPRPAKEVRKQYGYVEMRVDTADALERFLKTTQHLSRLQVRQGVPWAEGWHWTGIPAGKITSTDIAVLKRGYEAAYQNGSREPGFSLDPGKELNREEALSILKPTYPQAETIVEQVEKLLIDWNKALLSTQNHEKRSQIADKHIQQLNSLGKRYGEVVWAVFGAIKGQPLFQFARYDGGIERSEVGMTYFYTDLVAKAWGQGKGSTPAGKVAGFISDVQANTPWGHCTTEYESGRLWFGLREEALSFQNSSVTFGSIAARLFTLVNDADSEDREVEPSYRFGRLMWWWDRHYLAMADYEPQYHRLDQLMRWSAALGWLVKQHGVTLPELVPTVLPWTFKEWLAAHPEVKWRYSIPFLELPNSKTEALLTLSSKTYSDCGATTNFWAGGISNPSFKILQGIKEERLSFGSNVGRGGISKAGTNFSPITRTGTIRSGQVGRTLQPIAGTRSAVHITAEGRKAWSWGGAKVWIDESAQRQMAVALSAEPGQISQRLTVQGVEAGDLSITAEATTATIHWEPGPLARARQALNSVQEVLQKKSLPHAMAVSSGSSLVLTEPGGVSGFMRLDLPGAGARWLKIEKGAHPAGNNIAFRLGAAGKNGEPTWYNAEFAQAPPVKKPNGSPTEWMQFTAGSGKGPVKGGGADPPGAGAHKFKIQYAHEDRQGLLFIDDKQVRARADDPIVGLNGTSDGAAVVNGSALENLKTSQEAMPAYPRAVPLPNGSAALVDHETVTIVPSSDTWHARVMAAIKQGKDGVGPRIKVQDNDILLVGNLEAPKLLSSTGPMDLRDLLRSSLNETHGMVRGPPPMYLEVPLPKRLLEEARLPMDAGTKGTQVRVVDVEAPSTLLNGSGTLPGVITWNNKEWILYNAGQAAVLQPSQSLRFVYPDSDCDDQQDPQIHCMTARTSSPVETEQ